MPGDLPPILRWRPQWLADLLPRRDAAVRPLAERGTHALAAAVRRPGPRTALACALGRGEACGVDLVHAACQQLLAAGALPSLATLQLTDDGDDAFAESVVVGVLRACRAQCVELVTGDAARGEFDLALSLFGPVVGAPTRAPSPGDVVLALRGAGPVDADLSALTAQAAALGIGLADTLAGGDDLGALLTGARRSHIDVVQQPLRERWPCRLAAVGDASLQVTVDAMLPSACRASWDFGGFTPPSPFRDWWPDPTRLAAAAAHTSCGVGMLVCCAPAEAQRWRQLCGAWNEPATPIARIDAAP